MVNSARFPIQDVIGAEHAGKFSCMFDVSIGNGATRKSPGYRFQKRESCLMAMSYSYDMHQNIIPFEFEKKAIRVVTDENGEPMFVGKDICEALGYADHSNAMKLHCKGAAKYHPLKTKGGTQELRVLSEPDVMRLIVKSDLHGAVRFEAWVFEEVLPTIRKTGSYVVPTANHVSVAEIEQYGFVENQDFVCSPVSGSKGRGGHNAIDYHITFDMGKELSMVERNDKGKQARQFPVCLWLSRRTVDFRWLATVIPMSKRGTMASP